jgi:hypothetical protein
MMMVKRYYRNIAILLSLTALISVVVVSCGGGGGNDGGTTLTATQQAAASASAAQGAIALSSQVAGAADLASGYIPANYAPGKGGLQADTAAIANIDPRLKNVVDKMLAQVNRHAAKSTMAKSISLGKVLSAATITSSATITCDAGTIVVNDTLSSSGTSTTHTLSITYNNCKDNAFLSIANGSLSAVHTLASSETASVVLNLIDTTYTDISYSVASDVFALNGTFVSSITGTTGGSSSALGTFGWTMLDPVNGNIVMSFNFGTGATPISDTWTKLVSGGTTTETHTANGQYGLTISASGQSVTLGITLSSLIDRVVTSVGGVDEWINGSVAIGWSPDLSQWGCLNGTYVFTTTSPIHTASLSAYCPTSGVVQVNNALIEFGKPGGYNVKITLQPSGPSEVFVDCMSLGGDMCSSGGTAGSPTAAGSVM